MEMKRVLLLMGLAAAIACGSSAGDMMGEAFDDMTDVPDADAQSPGDGSSMQYVGNSTRTFRGDRTLREENGNTVEDEYGNEVRTGIFEYYAACQETFGPGTRICTSEEIRFTTDIPQVSGLAWYGIDADCVPFSSNTNSGTRQAVSPTGQFTKAPCSTSDPNAIQLPVACCGPR